MNRRKVFSAIGIFLSGLAFAQSASLKDKKAIVCSGSTVKCPNNHETCREIDAPIVVGNGNREYPDTGQLFDVKVLRCQQCGVLFTEH